MDQIPGSGTRVLLGQAGQGREQLPARRGGEDQRLEARIESLEMAFRMQTEAQEVFDLNRETKATREAYGSGQFANGCLVARRLVESGVRMVQVYYGNGQPWDDHGNIKAHADKARNVDQPIAALIRDLKQRDLLKDTLIVWGGEFGRRVPRSGALPRDLALPKQNGVQLLGDPARP